MASPAQELAQIVLAEKDAARAEGRKPFTIAISHEERRMLERYFGAGTGEPGCWPTHIAGVPIQVVG